MSVSKKIRSANLSHFLLLLLGSLLCTSIVVGLWVLEHRNYLFAEDNVFYNDIEEIQLGTYYKFDLYDVYDYYAYDDDGKYYITDVGSYDYPYCYMGFYIPDSKEGNITPVMNNTWNYYDGLEDDGSHFSGVCYLSYMDEQEEEFFYDYFAEDGYDTSNLIYLRLNYVSPSCLFDSYLFILALSIITLTCYTVNVIYLIISRKYRKNYERLLSIYCLSEEQLDMHMASSTKIARAYLGSSYLVNTYLSTFVVPYSDIRWTYLAPYFSRFKTFYTRRYVIMLQTNNGILMIKDLKKEVAVSLLQEIEKRSINLASDVPAFEKVTAYQNQVVNKRLSFNIPY